MSTRLLVLAGVLTTSTCAWAQKDQKDSGPELSAEDRALLDRVNVPVALRVPGMDQVRVLRDLVYQGAPRQRADVYLPRLSEGPAPIVILIHGGMGPEFPVRPKDWGIYQSYGRLMAASGLVAIAYNHRAGFPKVELEAASADLRDVIEFARAGAAKWGADGERICLAAFSGGGPLLGFAMRERRPFIKCLVGMYPVLDIEKMELFTSQMSAEELAKYAPVQHLSEAAPPLFIGRAGRDKIPDLLRGLDRFVGVALEKNADLTLMNHPEGEHGFDNDADHPRTQEILRAMLAFLDAHLARVK